MDCACKNALIGRALFLILVAGLAGCQTVQPEVSKPHLPVTAVDEAAPGPNAKSARDVVHSTLKTAGDNVICIGAIGDSPKATARWTTDKAFRMSVDEAKKRGLTPADCVVILSTISSTQIARALASRSKSRIDFGTQAAPSISDLIARADPKNSMWSSRAWGHGGSQSSLNVPAPSDRTQSARATALYIIRVGQAFKQLEGVLTDLVKGIPSYKTLEKSNPGTLLPRLVDEQVKSVVSRYRDEWEQILADVLAMNFTVSELRSLKERGKNSPYLQKFLANKPIVNQQIGERAKELLIKGTVAVLLMVQREIRQYPNT